MRHRSYLRLARLALLALLALLTAATGPWAAAQQPPGPAPDLLRLSRDVKGDSKPLIIAADDIVTWAEGTQRIVVMRGQVLAQQSVVQARFQQGVALIDLARWKSGILHVELYGEGAVRLDGGTTTEVGERIALELNTRGELKLQAYRNKVRQESLANDPLVQRASAARSLPGKPSIIVPVSGVKRLSFAPPDPIGPGGAPATPSAAVPPAFLTSPSPTVPPQPNNLPGFLPTAAPVPATSTQQGGPAPAVPPASPMIPQAVPPPEQSLGPSPPATPVPGNSGTPTLQAPGPTRLPPRSQLATPPPPPAEAPRPEYSITPRNALLYNAITKSLGDNLTAIIITNGAILNVKNVKGGIGLLDIEADRIVVYTRSLNAGQVFGGPQPPAGQSRRDLEFYLAGNVEIRQQSEKDSRILRADEVYYDVNRNTAIALRAHLEIRDKKIPEPFNVKAPELQQLAANQYKAMDALLFASKLSSDPGLTIYVKEATIEDRKVPQLSLFNTPVLNRKTGQPLEIEDTHVEAHNVFFDLENVPFFYSPYLAGNAQDPLGPLDSLSLGFSHLFGFTPSLTWDLYKLLGIQRYEGTKWELQTDYLSYRGPALGTTFDYSGKDPLGLPGKYEGEVRAYGIYDRDFDILGGPEFRSQGFDPDGFRGRALWRQNVYGLPEGFTVQSQISILSDRNFLEEYFKNEFDREINQSTFVYVKEQQGQFAATGLIEPRIRAWVNETESLPRLDGYVIGQSFFDLFTYNAHASAGYFKFLPTSDQYPLDSELSNPRPIYPGGAMDVRNFFPRVSSTDVGTQTGRFDVMQDLSLPFTLGAFRIVPYGMLDVADYTSNLYGEDVGRAWGGGGVRASIPFSRLYPEVQDELLNLNGIYHKITLSANYFIAGTNEPYNRLPQLDRLNDDATDQSVRDLRIYDPSLYGTTMGQILAASPQFDPQSYAIRSLILNRIDTLDNIQELQFDAQQRWQTKRGYPGAEHIVDWMVLDVSGIYFPAENRDNFGKPFGLLQYDYLWNIGDRTALTSSALVDPIDNGIREYTVGAYFNRPDRTNFFIGYRQIDPIDSRAVTVSLTYIFSPKYATTASTTYDFGARVQSNSLVFTRIGTDLQVSAGINYNSTTQSVGAVFMIVPVLLPANKQIGPGAVGPGTFGH